MPQANVVARETKTLKFKVKTTGITTDADGQRLGHIDIYGAAFNNVDEGNDRILPGAFARTIQNSKSRAKARNKKYALKMLWQHDSNEIIGGWHDMSEDVEGLRAKGDIALKTQRGAEFYELADLEMLDEFSIIYDVMPGGAKYDKSGVRELSELRLFSIDPVTFPMNDSPHTVSLKSMQFKSVCGDTSLPIGPRDESWDGSKAHNDIVKWATKADDSIDPAKMKKVHLQCDGDADKITSYGYAFCDIVDGSPQINVGGVKACANALAGARNADPGEDKAGMQKKVETLYSRINKKYSDADPLEAPWKDDGKMNTNQRQRKTLLEHYNDEQAQDLLEDWQDVYVCSLTSAILDAFTIGDQPAQDVGEALDAFKELVLSKFVAQAMECDLSFYLDQNTYSSSPAEYLMQYGSESRPDYGYGYMSRRLALQQKRGARTSASDQQVMDDHVAGLHATADKAMKAMKTAMAHMKSVHTAADDFATTMQGAEKPYEDDGEPDEGQQEGKAIERALSNLRALRN